MELPATGLFNLRKIEDIIGDYDLFHALHRHDFFFILAINRGKGKHEIDFSSHPVANNTVFIYCGHKMYCGGVVSYIDLRL